MKKERIEREEGEMTVDCHPTTMPLPLPPLLLSRHLPVIAVATIAPVVARARPLSRRCCAGRTWESIISERYTTYPEGSFI